MFLKVSTFAAMIDVEPRTVWRMIRKRQLPAYRLAKEYRISASDVQTFLRQRSTIGAAADPLGFDSALPSARRDSSAPSEEELLAMLEGEA